jgi:hypothetical protein
MPTGNIVVDRAIEAHGGETRWRQLTALKLTWTFRGTMFKMRLRENELRNLSARISTREQRVEITPFAGKEAKGVFTPGRVELGGQSLDAPRTAFKNLRTVFWWKDLEALYFSGYVLWNYAQLPFVLLTPGIVFEDLGTTTRNGETWNKVGATFPEQIATHSPKQVFYFGPDGLVRRHDYYVEIMSKLARGARYVHTNQQVDGFTLPQRIEIKLGLAGESYAPFPALGHVDLDAAQVE